MVLHLVGGNVGDLRPVVLGFGVEWSLLDWSLACLLPTSMFDIFFGFVANLFMFFVFHSLGIVDSSWLILQGFFWLGYYLYAS